VTAIGATARRAAALLTYAVLLAACSGRDTESISMGSDVLVSRADGSASNEVVLFSGAFDVDVAIAALERAGARFLLVDDRGTEYATEAEVEEALQRHEPGEFYTPNYVADPKVVGNGIELYVDCKGVIPTPMGATFRRILREELRRGGITKATVRNSPG
jgi:hypothetical protein